MSSTLYWEPVQRKQKDLPNTLKYVLQKKIGGTVDTVMSEHDISYLRGLEDAGIEGATELIKAIEKHGQVVVHEQF